MSNDTDSPVHASLEAGAGAPEITEEMIVAGRVAYDDWRAAGEYETPPMATDLLVAVFTAMSRAKEIHASDTQP
jgi:hypothetical protein